MFWISLGDWLLVGFLTCGSSTHGALKTRSCSRLDWWVILAWSLKTISCSILNLWILNVLQAFDSWNIRLMERSTCGTSLLGALKMRRLSGPPLLLFACDAAGLFDWFRCFYLQRSRELVSLICGIFFKN